MAILVLLPRSALGQEVVDAFENAIQEEGLEPKRKQSGFALVPGSVREVPERSSLMFSIPFEGEEPFEIGTFDVWVEPSSGGFFYRHNTPIPALLDHFDEFSRMRLRVFKNSKRSWSLVFKQLRWYRRRRPSMFWLNFLACCCIPVLGWVWGAIELVILHCDYNVEITYRITSLDDLEGEIATKIRSVLLGAFEQLKPQDAIA